MAIIKPRRGTAAPGTGTITQNELAVDTTNKRIYIGAADGSGTLIGAAPGGSDTQVQFNDSGNLGGDSGLTYNKTTDTLTIGGNLVLNAQGDLRLSDADSSNYIAFQAPTTVSNNNVYTLPSAVGSANQVLRIASVASNDATLEWATVSGGGTPGGSDTQVQFNDGGSTFGGDAGLTYNKTTDTLTIAGDLAVNGADITTTSTGTATLFNTNATTVNIAGAATSLTIGATSGTITVRNSSLYVGNTTGTITSGNGTLILYGRNTVGPLNSGTLTELSFSNGYGFSNASATFSGGDLILGTKIDDDLGETEGSCNLKFTSVVGGIATLQNSSTSTSRTITLPDATGTIALTANKLSVFAATTSSELAGVISDETGTGALVFGTSPSFTTSVVTGSTSFNVFNTTATTINAFGAATTISIGASTGTTTINNSLNFSDGSTQVTKTPDFLLFNMGIV